MRRARRSAKGRGREEYPSGARRVAAAYSKACRSSLAAPSPPPCGELVVKISPPGLERMQGPEARGSVLGQQGEMFGVLPGQRLYLNHAPKIDTFATPEIRSNMSNV